MAYNYKVKMALDCSPTCWLLPWHNSHYLMVLAYSGIILFHYMVLVFFCLFWLVYGSSQISQKRRKEEIRGFFLVEEDIVVTNPRYLFIYFATDAKIIDF